MACRRCGRSGHWEAQCYAKSVVGGGPSSINLQKPSAKRARSNDDLSFATCHRCGRSGHWAVSCYARTKVGSSTTVMQFVPSKPMSMPIISNKIDVCFRCGRQGHWTSECFATTHVNGPMLFPTASTGGVPFQQHDSCSRCGRTGHVITACFAKTHMNGSLLVIRDQENDDRQEVLHHIEEASLFFQSHTKLKSNILLTCCWNDEESPLPGTRVEGDLLGMMFSNIIRPPSCTPDILRQNLQSVEMWHFTGHGRGFKLSNSITLGLMDAHGKPTIIPQDTIVDLALSSSQNKGGKLRLVFLNACSSGDLGRKLIIDASIPYVVCWDTVVDDSAALAFAKGFWLAIARGQSIDESFRAGKLCVETIICTVAGAAKYKLDIDPEFFPSGTLPDGRVPAGVPILLKK